MHKRKKVLAVFMALMMTVFSFASCGASSSDEKSESTTAATGGKKDGKILVAYFSRVGNVENEDSVDAIASASVLVEDGEHKGNTQKIAEMIQEEVGGDLYLIKTRNPYPSDYSQVEDIGQQEGRENARPELVNPIEDISQYDTIYLGFPNWWYDAPMAIYSFLEQYDLSGKTIVPFNTSGGSGFSNSIDEIKKLEPEANVLEGLSVYQEDVADAQNQVREWINK